MNIALDGSAVQAAGTLGLQGRMGELLCYDLLKRELGSSKHVAAGTPIYPT